jgi:hypothetical protein
MRPSNSPEMSHVTEAAPVLPEYTARKSGLVVASETTSVSERLVAPTSTLSKTSDQLHVDAMVADDGGNLPAGGKAVSLGSVQPANVTSKLLSRGNLAPKKRTAVRVGAPKEEE